MKKDYLELYTDYLISGNGYATATGLSAMMENEISHDQITRFLSKNKFIPNPINKLTIIPLFQYPSIRT